MTRQIDLTLSPNWEELQGGAGAVQRLMRRDRTNKNNLEISMTWNQRGTPLDPRPDPAGLAATLGTKRGATVESRSEGKCAAGRYGRVVLSLPGAAYAEAWIVTDDMHLFLATYTCDVAPTREELQEVADMVMSVRWRGA